MPIHNKLLAVQESLKAPKSQQNTFGKYKYRSCEDILEAVKPLLKAQGLVLTLTDEVVMIGTRFYVVATAQVHDGTDAAIVRAFAREEEDKKGMDGSQITGAASSYARKYALNGLFLIDDTKDSDATNTHDKKAAKPTSDDTVARIVKLCTDLGKDEAKMWEHYSVPYRKPTDDQARTILNQLTSAKRSLDRELDAK